MDVDTGVDDCIALLYAVASPEVELVAATCCAGNVVAPRAAANTLAVLELAGAGDVEVALGSLAPLVAPLRTAVFHGPGGLGYAELPPARRAPPAAPGACRDSPPRAAPPPPPPPLPPSPARPPPARPPPPRGPPPPRPPRARPARAPPGPPPPGRRGGRRGGGGGGGRGGG